MTGEEFTDAERRNVLAASCLAIFITPLMGTMVNLALVSIGNEFSIGTHTLGWVTMSFFLASVCFLVPFARISSIWGKRRIFIIGLIIVAIGNIAAAFSVSVWMLIMFRVLSGAGAAAISCSSVSMLSDVYPRSQRGFALGINTAAVYLGASIGPSLGGVITDTLGWRSIFLVVIPFALAALFAISRFKTEFTSCAGEPFDLPSTVLYIVGVMSLMYGICSLPVLTSILFIVAGVVIMVVFVMRQLAGEYPLFDVRIFRNSPFTRSTMCAFFNYSASYATTFFVSLYLQSVGALTATQAGMLMLIQPVIQVVLTPIAGKMSDRLDKRILPTIGMALTLVGLLIMQFIDVEASIPIVALSLAVQGVGYGLFSAPNTNAVMFSVTRDKYNDASAMISTMRQTGMMVSTAIAMCTIAIIMGSADHLVPENYPSFVLSLHISMAICAFMCLMGTVLSWFRGTPPAQDN